MNDQKLTHSAGIIDRVLKILQGFAIAGVIVCAIFVPLTLIFGEKIVAASNSLTIGPLQLVLKGSDTELLDPARMKGSIVIMLLAALLTAAATWYCLKVLREILSPMKEGQPFAAGISGKIRKLAWAVLIGGLVAECGGTVAAIFELRAYQFERLLDQSLISAVSYNISIDLWPVIAGLILFFLSYVFRYGETLQQEADETL